MPDISHQPASRLSRDSALLTTPIAHRGLHSDSVPENSMAAFEWAIRCGLPIELDVHLLADGGLAVFHDFDLARMTGDTRTVLEICAHDAANLHLRGSSETVPLLSHVLELVHGRVPLLIELKEHTFSGKLEAATVELLAGYSGEFAVQSFNYESVLWLKNNAPEICRGQLASGDQAVPHYLETLPDFISYELGSLPHPDTTGLRNMGVPLLAWTITDLTQRARAIELADNYIFNQSEELLAAIGLRP